MHDQNYHIYLPCNPIFHSFSTPQYLLYAPQTYNSILDHRIFPPVNPNTLMDSARQSKDLLRDAQTVSDGVYKSHTFSKQLMEAAQQSNTDLVKNLISSLAIRNYSEISYNPDGIRITFTPKNQLNNCCTVSLSLKWQNFL